MAEEKYIVIIGLVFILMMVFIFFIPNIQQQFAQKNQTVTDFVKAPPSQSSLPLYLIFFVVIILIVAVLLYFAHILGVF